MDEVPILAGRWQEEFEAVSKTFASPENRTSTSRQQHWSPPAQGNVK